MKKLALIVLGSFVIAGCSGNKNRVDTVREEVLSREMVTPEIEVTHSGCGTVNKLLRRKCQIVRIDSVGTAASNGGTTILRSNAYLRACDQALANVSHWMGQRVSSDRLEKTVGNSGEGSNSKELQNSTDNSGNYETSQRENVNDTRIEIINTIRVSSQQFLVGWKPIREGNPVIDKQEVKCVQRWDRLDVDFIRQLSSIR